MPLIRRCEQDRTKIVVFLFGLDTNETKKKTEEKPIKSRRMCAAAEWRTTQLIRKIQLIREKPHRIIDHIESTKNVLSMDKTDDLFRLVQCFRFRLCINQNCTIDGDICRT